MASTHIRDGSLMADRPTRTDNSNLVVVVIIAYKTTLSQDERASLEQCSRVLGHYPIRLVCPTDLDPSAYLAVVPAAEVDYIDPKWLADVSMYSRLMTSPEFYERFSGYRFMLMYQLDAWVFEDRMLDWCARGYDYIGAPWVERVVDGAPEFYPAGGNGGFSLRRVQACLDALSIRTFRGYGYHRLKAIWRARRGDPGISRLVRLPDVLLRVALGRLSFGYPEDLFWCKDVVRIDPRFRPAPAEVGREFAFEAQPSLLYKVNGQQLPFGCHGWRRFEPEFWKSFIPASLDDSTRR